MAEKTLTYRNARDRMMDWMAGQQSYPARDLPINPFSEKVGYNNPAMVILQHSQLEVEYTLMDITAQSEGVQVGNTQEGSGGTLSFATHGLINRFYSFRILAKKFIRENGAKVYLNQALLFTTVTIRVGLDTSLQVELVHDLLDFGTATKVVIRATQQNVAYELYAKGSGTLLGENRIGEGGDLFIPTLALTEDTEVQVKAVNQNPGENEETMLTQTVQVGVRPNPQPGIALVDSTIDYNTPARIRVIASQASTKYYVRTEWKDDDNWDPAVSMNSRTSMDRVGTDGELIISSYQIKEDTRFHLIAVKRSTVETQIDAQGNPIQVPVELQVVGTLTVLVRPNTHLNVTAVPESVPLNTTGLIRISNPQHGVHYQLRNAVNNAKIGTPGFFHWDRGIRTSSVGMDFVIGQHVGTKIDLPTSTINGPKTYNLLATKARTGVEAVVATTVTVTLAP